MRIQFKAACLASAVALALTGCGDDDNATNAKISSVAPTVATEDVQFSYAVKVANAEKVTYALTTAPTGMAISETGVVTWTPGEGVLTSDEVHVKVTADGHVLDHKFTIVVTPVNDAPVLSAVGPQRAYAGERYSLQLVVNDPDDNNDGQQLRFTLQGGPEGLIISPTGEVTLTSSVTQSQLHDTVTVSVKDGGEDGAQASTISFSLDEIYRYIVSGALTDYYDNTQIPNGTVVFASNGERLAETTSDENGEYTLAVEDRLVGERITVSADAVGYREAAKTISLAETVLIQELQLPPIHSSQQFDPTQPTDVAVEGVTLVTLPANGLVDSNGNAPVGAVTAELTIIDPASDIHLMPGDMVTPDPSNPDALVPIESFGAITATFVDEAGNELQLAEGQTSAIRIPVSGYNPPATIPLYYYDPIAGMWFEEGEATLVNAADGDFYEGTVSHFTTWNADRRYETIFINGCVADTAGARIANVRVNMEGVNYSGRSSTYSDIDGNFAIPARINSTQLVSATFGQSSRVQTVISSAVDNNLPDCLLLDTASTQITLRWGERPRDLDSHFLGPNGQDGQFHVSFSNKQVTVNDKLIFLDVDDTSSFGPEVVSLYDFPAAGTYGYFVHNYSGETVTWNGARVNLNIDGYNRAYTPPGGSLLRYWHVFNIEVDELGGYEVVRINEWKDSLDMSTPPTIVIPTAPRHLAAPKTFDKPMHPLLDKLMQEKYYAK
ncbi:putative Ig domain-containing protein [Photobacterium aphoticum]|uniref:Dystroglycan-type cadherin-like domain-containing protein n=1 Tax=Photobacterium aphoticum TaxID=754436 RepID=A0A0J1GHI0_9GAMM|nr:putative Ig domain-containing protein [Photobacterium aphoticum]KLU99154.1 hypothetical protein ABT58_19285 [Photobacterium aphoticum]GHA45174.1 hypothetical protein GCM10007086_18390 [Photobacterium aphoticum]